MQTQELASVTAPDEGEPVTSGLTASDFRRVSANGFGEAHSGYPHAMVWFKNRLYVCVTRGILAVRGVERKLRNPELMGEIWPVKIPAKVHDLDLRSRIWRYDPACGVWDRVYISPRVAGSAGFDVPLTVGFRTITVFQGPGDSAPAIYAPTTATSYHPHIFMMKSFDGENFEVASEPGMGITPPTRALRGLVPFDGRLFTSPTATQQRYSYNYAEFMSILVTSDPRGGKWQQACEPSFGNPNNLSVFDMTVFDGHLYAGTTNIQQGYEVWKTDTKGDPPYKWKKVIGNGAYRGRLSQGAITLYSFGAHLYVGGAIQYGGFDPENNAGPAAPELIRIHRDDSWDLIAGDPRMTPDGLKVPLSGLGPGFGNPFAGYFWSMCSHEGWLYVGNLTGVAQAKFAKKENWPDWAVRLLDEDTLEKLLQKIGGFGLWRSRDGRRWRPVTLNGFDNYYNYGVRTMVSTPHGLFVGAANPYTPEVAVHGAAGWRYEDNPRGGLEIWLGSSTHRSQSGPDAVQKHSRNATPAEKTVRKSRSDGKWTMEELIRAFYGGSDFRHMGYWSGGIRDTRTACESLMEEILALLPDKKGRIVDIGCGAGETTRCLLKHFPPEVITAVTWDKDIVAVNRKKVPSIHFLFRRGPKLKLPPDSFDYAVWVKGLAPLIPRAKLLPETFRILKPGGSLVCVDVLRPHQEAPAKRSFFKRERFHPQNPTEYRTLLCENGFQNARIIDITHRSLEPFREHRVQYFDLKRLSGEIDDKLYTDVSDYFSSKELCILGYVLIEAQKPIPEPADR